MSCSEGWGRVISKALLNTASLDMAVIVLKGKAQQYGAVRRVLRHTTYLAIWKPPKHIFIGAMLGAELHWVDSVSRA